MDQVWVTIRAQAARTRMLELLDHGSFAEALGKKSYLDGLIEKIKAFVQQYGGSMPIDMYDCVVMQISAKAAEQLPSIIEAYQDHLKNQISVGVGLTYSESAKAAQKSAKTGSIELYDSSVNDFLEKTSRRISHPDVTLPANVFNPSSPDDDYYQPGDMTDNPAAAPDADQALEIETAYIGKLIQQMSPQEAPPQMAPEGEAPPEEGGDEQGNTMELLQMMGQGQQAAPAEGEAAPAEGEAPPEEAEQELQAEVDEAEQEAEKWDNDQLAQTLQSVSAKIPQIMAMADQNPDAFKQTINMVNKLIAAAKQRPKDVKKHEEIIAAAEELTKDFNNRRISSGPGAGKNTHFPVGTRKRNYKKVLVDGREVWRSFKTGQVKDDEDGTDISVRQHNVKQQQKQ